MSELPKVVVTRSEETPADTIARTPQGTDDLRVIAMSAAQRVIVRAVRVYLFALLGLLGADAISTVAATGGLPLHEAGAKLWSAAQYAVYPTVVGVLWNVYELFNKWDQSHPELRA